MSWLFFIVLFIFYFFIVLIIWLSIPLVSVWLINWNCDFVIYTESSKSLIQNRKSEREKEKKNKNKTGLWAWYFVILSKNKKVWIINLLNICDSFSKKRSIKNSGDRSMLWQLHQNEFGIQLFYCSIVNCHFFLSYKYVIKYIILNLKFHRTVKM